MNKMNGLLKNCVCGRGCNRQGGVTMVELLLGMVVAGIVVAGLASQVANMVKYSQLPRLTYQSIFLLEAKMEEVLFLSRTVGVAGINSAALPDEPHVDPSGPFYEYSRYLTFADVATGGSCGSSAGCLEVGVTVNSGGEVLAKTSVLLEK